MFMLFYTSCCLLFLITCYARFLPLSFHLSLFNCRTYLGISIIFFIVYFSQFFFSLSFFTLLFISFYLQDMSRYFLYILCLLFFIVRSALFLPLSFLLSIFIFKEYPGIFFNFFVVVYSSQSVLLFIFLYSFFYLFLYLEYVHIFFYTPSENLWKGNSNIFVCVQDT